MKWAKGIKRRELRTVVPQRRGQCIKGGWDLEGEQAFNGELSVGRSQEGGKDKSR